MSQPLRLLRDWRVKGLVQRLLASVPGGVAVNAVLQRRFGELRDPRANFDGKLGDWAGLMTLLARAGRPSVEGLALLEIGSGWYPAIPLLFALAGARRCDSYDIARHFDAELLRRFVAHVEPRLPEIAETAQRDASEVRAHWRRIADAPSIAELLDRAGIAYHAPADASRSGLDAGSVDIAFSNSVLEHVPVDALPALLAECRRVIGTRGLTLHAVACNDHYAHFDRSISFVNYLRYDARTWRRWNNALNYQNRLRASEFVALAQAAGLELVAEQRAVRPGTREALASLPLAAEFRRFAPDDLATTTLNFVARAAGAPQTP